MGRSYLFECSHCGYRAKVSGRADRGLDVFVQTILCQDCKELHDAVTRIRFPADGPRPGIGLRLNNQHGPRDLTNPPAFQAMLNRLPYTGVRRFRWVRFRMQCPQSALHRVRAWNDPDKCPKCGVFLDQHALPYRLWD